MGGPATTDRVGDFLLRLFSDPDLIPLGRFQGYLAPIISRLRTRKIQKQYQMIGGGSPIRMWSEYQAGEVCKILDETSPATAPHKPYVAFRYADPLMEDTYARLLSDGFGERGRAIAFSQYPQFSCSTTGSSLNELGRLRDKLEGARNSINTQGICWTTIDRWPTHPGFVKAIANNITKRLSAYPEDRRRSVTLLFSAHSQPMSAVNKGDSYSTEVASSVHAVMQELNFSNPYRICWQSKVGLQHWLEPRTDETVRQLIAKGKKDLIIIPVSFTSDHIETLYEIDQELIEESDHGGSLTRAESLNGSRLFIEALAQIVREHLRGGLKASRQLEQKCLGCQKESCSKSRDMFCQGA
ncbi:hypothetical protein HIM_11484 [Hirsutella minnesotensis 3608]|uniref:Ferrochelatase n=1 Tax=Hirsutella minnesotensis 3608 TaxID=1043627 RepID=A0A0F7ZFH0_9HYPO|nr:hypothetical protein HIM_11484 [Hirsutella minnesotensis 3608]